MGFDYAPVSHGTIFVDKAYCDADLPAFMKKNRMITVVTPRKNMIFFLQATVSILLSVLSASPLSPFFTEAILLLVSALPLTLVPFPVSSFTFFYSCF